MTAHMILGFDAHTNCDHCGRGLKIGIKLGGYGTVGADCLNAAIVFDRKRWGAGRPGASYLRDLAKLKEGRSDAYLAQRGYSARAFCVEVADGALS